MNDDRLPSDIHSGDMAVWEPDDHKEKVMNWKVLRQPKVIAALVGGLVAVAGVCGLSVSPELQDALVAFLSALASSIPEG